MHNKAEARPTKHKKTKSVCGEEHGGPSDLVMVSLITFSTIFSGGVRFLIQPPPPFLRGEAWNLKAQSKTPEGIWAELELIKG